MNNPHKHAALIKAWADGAEIEYRYNQWLHRWHPVGKNPAWHLDVEYRVKPAPHPHQDLIDAFRNGDTNIQFQMTDGSWQYMQDNFRRDCPEYHPSYVMRRAHKWQKEMDAYAVGKVIQYRNWKYPRHGWRDCLKDNGTGVPMWYTNDGVEYRIKPETVVRYLSVDVRGSKDVLHSVEQGPKTPHNCTNLKLTFEEGKLIAAEVLK